MDYQTRPGFRSQPKTPLAEIYTHPVDVDPDDYYHSAIANYVPFKSGFTPVPEGGILTEKQQEVEAYQNSRFHGFTTAQLQTMKALSFTAPDDMSANLDSVPIHELFKRERWMQPQPAQRAPWPMGKGREGFWHASNPEVWAILEPILKIASLVLVNAHLWPWWDAFIAGERTLIDPSEIPPIRSDGRARSTFVMNNQRRFHRRLPELANTIEARQQIQDEFLRMANNIDFHLSCGRAHDDTFLPLASAAHGWTSWATSWRRTQLTLSFQNLEPLLDPGLHSVERMMIQYHCASILVHELAHAIYQNSEGWMPQRMYDLYFENEVLPELGFSMQNAVFGGVIVSLNESASRLGIPFGGMASQQWQSYASETITIADSPILLNLKWDYWQMSSFPIPVEYFRNMNNADYWNSYVVLGGPTGAQATPLTCGSIYQAPEAQYDEWDETSVPSEEPVIDDTMTAAQKTAVLFEVSRIRLARQIAITMADSVSARFQRDQDFQTGASEDVPLGSLLEGDPYEEERYTPPCPRFNLILQALITNFHDLQLHNMDFEIAEHMLYWYLIRYGLTGISITEWRAFLVQCDVENKYFIFNEYGNPPTATQGTILIRPEGWPPSVAIIPPIAYVQAVGAFGTMFAAWLKAMNVIGRGDYDDFVFADGMREFDRGVVVEACRRVMDVQGWRGSEVTEAEFEQCVLNCEMGGRWWCRGPVRSGAIRKLANGWPKVEANLQSMGGVHGFIRTVLEDV